MGRERGLRLLAGQRLLVELVLQDCLDALVREGLEVERPSAGALEPAGLVVLNPPRTGVAPAVTARLAAGDAERLVYISCDPATLARDATRLAPAWRLGAVRAFDLFPQTAHVETVARFERP